MHGLRRPRGFHCPNGMRRPHRWVAPIQLGAAALWVEALHWVAEIPGEAASQQAPALFQRASRSNCSRGHITMWIGWVVGRLGQVPIADGTPQLPPESAQAAWPQVVMRDRVVGRASATKPHTAGSRQSSWKPRPSSAVARRWPNPARLEPTGAELLPARPAQSVLLHRVEHLRRGGLGLLGPRLERLDGGVQLVLRTRMGGTRRGLGRGRCCRSCVWVVGIGAPLLSAMRLGCPRHVTNVVGIGALAPHRRWH